MGDPENARAEIAVFLDDEREPLATYRPPATFTLDTTTMEDGDHILRLRAIDSMGKVSNRTMKFSVHNGPGITVTGLREGSRVSGQVELNLNAFSASEPFDPVRAESSAPVPVWTWVMIGLIGIWAGWYGIEYMQTPPAFANTPTYAANPALASAQAPMTSLEPPNTGNSGKNIAGFDYATLGPTVFANNCASCHGAQGAGITGTFPPLVSDPVVNAKDASDQIGIVLHGLSGKSIAGVRYGAAMPAFASQLTDQQIAAVIDHERTSWGNHGPTITPEQVTKKR
jgi:mono/diheme cytochrome c family protein